MLARVVRRLSKEASILGIALVGSRSKGIHTEHSDFDLLILTRGKKSEERFYENGHFIDVIFVPLDSLSLQMREEICLGGILYDPYGVLAKLKRADVRKIRRLRLEDLMREARLHVAFSRAYLRRGKEEDALAHAILGAWEASRFLVEFLGSPYDRTRGLLYLGIASRRLLDVDFSSPYRRILRLDGDFPDKFEYLREACKHLSTLGEPLYGSPFFLAGVKRRVLDIASFSDLEASRYVMECLAERWEDHPCPSIGTAIRECLGNVDFHETISLVSSFVELASTVRVKNKRGFE